MENPIAPPSSSVGAGLAEAGVGGGQRRAPRGVGDPTSNEQLRWSWPRRGRVGGGPATRTSRGRRPHLQRTAPLELASPRPGRGGQRRAPRGVGDPTSNEQLRWSWPRRGRVGGGQRRVPRGVGDPTSNEQLRWSWPRRGRVEGGASDAHLAGSATPPPTNSSVGAGLAEAGSGGGPATRTSRGRRPHLQRRSQSGTPPSRHLSTGRDASRGPGLRLSFRGLRRDWGNADAGPSPGAFSVTAARRSSDFYP
jgi:hypothetical protein